MMPSLTDVRWRHATRIIASRFPPIDLYERLTKDTEVRAMLIEAEMMTNPRLRQEAGQISLVEPEDRVFGPGATYVMAPFVHLNPRGSRFSDGSYGVYYAAKGFETALHEVSYHFGLYAADAADDTRYEDMRVLVGEISESFHDVSALPDAGDAARILSPSDYTASRAFARALRDTGSNGILYPSVRHAGGHCIGAFRPRAVGIPVQERHIQFHWDGARVARWFDYQSAIWHEIASDLRNAVPQGRGTIVSKLPNMFCRSHDQPDGDQSGLPFQKV